MAISSCYNLALQWYFLLTSKLWNSTLVFCSCNSSIQQTVRLSRDRCPKFFELSKLFTVSTFFFYLTEQNLFWTSPDPTEQAALLSYGNIRQSVKTQRNCQRLNWAGRHGWMGKASSSDALCSNLTQSLQTLIYPDAMKLLAMSGTLLTSDIRKDIW